MSEIFNKAMKFAEQHIAPVAKELDVEKKFAKDVFKKLGDEGYLKLVLPKEYGGEGLGIEAHKDVIRALSNYSASVGLCYMMHNVGIFEILGAGSEDLKSRTFKEVISDHALLGLAHSEFTTGTHFYAPQATIEDKGDHVIINGVKSMVTTADNARYLSVVCKSKKDGEVDHWMVPTDAPGITFKHDAWDGLGVRSNVSCPMELKDVKVSMAQRVGDWGVGVPVELDFIAPPFILGLAAVSTGICEAALREAIENTKSRKYPTGKTISNFEQTQRHIADMYKLTLGCIALTDEAGRAAAAKEEDAATKIFAARIFGFENAMEVCKLGMGVCAGRAYNKIGPMERYLRDSYAGHIMAPGADVLHLWLGRVLVGEAPIQNDL